MADWKKLAKALALADGRLDTKETNIIRKELFGDGRIDKSELEFLLDLKKHATSVVREFNLMVHSAVEPFILADGDISAKEAAWLKTYLFSDGQVDDDEKALLKTLKTKAKATSPEFEALYKEVIG
jgi:uncharacterized tellurite resistance protein B-like protein